jgi:hypothetical protein
LKVAIDVTDRQPARPMTGRMMTLEALADELGVGVGVVREMRRNGLPGYSPPGTKRILVDLDEVFAWIREHRS